MVRQRENNDPEPTRGSAKDEARQADAADPAAAPGEEEEAAAAPEEERVEGEQPPREADAAQPPKRARRGFAAMDPELRREIARRGGAASHEHGRAHEWSAEEARGW